MKIQPIGFPLEWTTSEHVILYNNIHEIGQGGPEVGNVTIDGKNLPGLYGGPPLIVANDVYFPFVKRNFWGATRFILAKVNLSTLNIVYIKKNEHLILLFSVDDSGGIHYYNDLENFSEVVVCPNK